MRAIPLLLFLIATVSAPAAPGRSEGPRAESVTAAVPRDVMAPGANSQGTSSSRFT